MFVAHNPLIKFSFICSQTILHANEIGKFTRHYYYLLLVHCVLVQSNTGIYRSCLVSCKGWQCSPGNTGGNKWSLLLASRGLGVLEWSWYLILWALRSRSSLSSSISQSDSSLTLISSSEEWRSRRSLRWEGTSALKALFSPPIRGWVAEWGWAAEGVRAGGGEPGAEGLGGGGGEEPPRLRRLIRWWRRHLARLLENQTCQSIRILVWLSFGTQNYTLQGHFMGRSVHFIWKKQGENSWMRLWVYQVYLNFNKTSYLPLEVNVSGDLWIYK